MEEQLQVGDVVKLRGSNITMTVNKLDDSTVECVWFTNLGGDVWSSLNREWFGAAALEKISP